MLNFFSKIRLSLFLFIFLIAFVGIWQISSVAQTENSSETGSASPTQISNKAELIDSKKASRDRLISERNAFDAEKTQLRSVVATKEAELKEIEKSLEETTEENGLNILERREKLQEAERLKTEIQENNRKIRANEAKIEVLNNEIENLERELKIDETAFQNLIISFLINIFGYLILIFFYWAAYKYLLKALNKLENKKVSRLAKKILLITVLVLTVLTLLFAFIRNLTLLLGSFGLASAALVVALQDFVSSFFAWVMINSSKQYTIGDIIKLQPTAGDKVFGKVKEIGLFRTFVAEMEGGEMENKERDTGRIVSFPNNLFLRVSVTNYTQESKILWHNLNLTITFESSFDETEKVLHKIIENVFKKMVIGKKRFLENVKNTDKYKPTMHISIDNSGPKFSIWFACQVGTYRDILEIFSKAILKEFGQNPNLDLAYPTRRVLSTQFLPDSEYNQKFALNNRFDRH